MARIKRSGRRSGKPDTREEILTAARALFAAEGIESVSIRRIAAAADVDPALIHHYFGTKNELFMAAIELPIDPAPEVAATIKAGGLEGVGGRVIHTLVNIWEGPHQAKLIAVVRSGLSKPAMSLILRQLFEHRILTTLTDSFGDQIDHHRFRANLVGSQIFGLICTRYIVKIQPIASLDVDTLAAAVGPTIDRYLTMPVDHLVDGDLSGFEPTTRRGALRRSPDGPGARFAALWSMFPPVNRGSRTGWRHCGTLWNPPTRRPPMSSTPEASPTPPRPEESERAAEPPPTESDAPSPHQTPPQPMPPAQVAHHPYTGPVQVGPPPPPDWDLRDTRWDRPEGGAAPLLVLLVAAVAIFGGVAAFFTDGVGIGMALTGIAMVSVPLLMAGRDGLAARLPGAVLIAGLWSVAAIRDSGWIVTLCAVTALLLTPLALAPQRRFTGTIAAALGYLEGLGESFRWTNRGRRTGKSANTGRNLQVIAITAILLLVFGGLFAAADQNFANLLAGLVPDVSPAEFFLRMMLTLLLFPLLLLWAYMAVARPRFDPEEPAEPRTVSRFEIAVPLGALNLLFALFIVMQARTYFGGEDFVMETAGLTFAEYARRGFWQLSVVAVLALVVVAVAAWKAPRRRRSDRWVLRVLLGALCAMSLVVVGSAMFRMSVYFETFGLTRLRLWVFTVEIWLAVLFLLVLVCCWKLRAWWLPQGILASGVLVLLGLAAVNPDGIIARYNVERFETTGKLDVEYLHNLSADAVPVLMELPDEERECVMRWGGRDWDDRPLMAWNLGFDRAAELKADFEHVRRNDCRDHIGPGYDEPRESVPGPSDTEAGAAEPDQTEPIAGAAFFGGATCAQIDMTAADEMFGTGAKGEFGTEPDPSNLYGTVTGPDDSDGEAPYAELHCGYFGIGTGYVALDVELWASPDRALTAVEVDRTERLDNGYEVDDLGSETTAGHTAVFEAENSSYTEYQYWFAIDEVTYRASVMDGPINDRARSVCEDLTGQLVGAYTELA